MDTRSPPALQGKDVRQRDLQLGDLLARHYPLLRRDRGRKAVEIVIYPRWQGLRRSFVPCDLALLHAHYEPRLRDNEHRIQVDKPLRGGPAAERGRP